MASWYERRILPHIIKLGCGCRALAEDRQAIVSQARGRVLELGMGAGANLPYYRPETIERVIGIEPSAELRTMAIAAARAPGLEVEIAPAPAEDLPFASATFDSVVCTFTLCTVADPGRALAEARRVLRPGGLFLFCEHGAAPDANVAKWQQRMEPIWRRMFGGCHLTRPVSAGIARHFTIDAVQSRYQPGTPRIAGWMEAGRAIAR